MNFNTINPVQTSFFMLFIYGISSDLFHKSLEVYREPQVVSLDISKAFEKVEYEASLKKL